ncbi:MAG: TonB-dependent receptor [Gemmatimonadota bacterium]|nr:TonB-dependent receptor [Gemmatimonadota bacterium]
MNSGLPNSRWRGAGRVCALSALLMPGTLRAQKPDSAAADSVADRKRPVVLAPTVITATRTSQGVHDVPVNVVVFQQTDIQQSAAKSVSDFLHVIPGYTTKDYQSSLVMSNANSAPSLRGLGGTSASRTLVLLDGIPMNEPFAGWVYWPRVPLALVRQLDVVRGGSAAVWGDRAMGGVINLITVDPRENALTLDALGGSYGTARAEAVGTARRGRVGLLFAGDVNSTNGYPNVPAPLRGPIDLDVRSRDNVLFGKAMVDVTPQLQVSLTGNYLDDQRRNGTPLKVSSTQVSDLRSGVRLLTGDGSLISAHAYASHTRLAQFQTSESKDRTTETPSVNQFDVPADAFGIQAQWSKPLFHVHELSAGADVSAVRGAVNEDVSYSQGAFTRRRRVTGHQSLIGAYLSDGISLGDHTRLLASLRRDAWRNDDASRVIRDLRTGGLLVDSAFEPTSSSRMSYSLGAQHRAGAVSFRGSAYQSFRAPTLNELYKPFSSSGNTITEANAELRPETLRGFDLGADYAPAPGFLARLTAFWNTVRDPVQEITIGLAGGSARDIQPCGRVQAGGTCRQRQNLDAFDTHGIEAEVEAHPSANWSLRGGYAWNPTEITAAPTQPQLVGKAARGTSRNQYSVGVAYTNPARIDASMLTRFVGQRYDDDLNSLALESFYVTDARVSRQLNARARLVASVENLFDREYPVSRSASGFVRVGGPRFFEAGVHYEW